ncbi:MAG: HNH endonuclease family protein, partial [Brevinema sp.]
FSKENVREVISDIKKIIAIDQFKEEKINKLKNMVLGIYPVDTLILYPYYIFIYGHGNFTDEFSTVSLSEDDLKTLHMMLHHLIRYIYGRGLIYRSINGIKNEIFNSCIKIHNKDSLLSLFALSAEDLDKLEAELSQLKANTRYTKGILGLYHYLAKNQGHCDFRTFHVEHILPKSYQHYDGWTKEMYEQYINSIGNLTLLEKKLNIKAKNEYLQKKQNTAYAESKIIDVNDKKNRAKVINRMDSLIV